MNEQQVQQMIHQALSSWSAKSQYGVSAVPVHAHTGYDGSPKVSYQNLSNLPSYTLYGGSVAANGNGILLPSGWGSSVANTSQYTITHTLGTTDYSISAVTTSAADDTSPHLLQVNSKAANDFTIYTYNSSGAGVAYAFDFLVAVLS